MDQERSPDHAQSFAHAHETEAALQISRFGVKPEAVILDPKYQVAAFDIQRNPQTTRLRMLQGILQGLLKYPIGRQA